MLAFSSGVLNHGVMKSLAELSHLDFEPLVGTIFTWRDGVNAVPLQLLRVQARPSGTQQRAAFSLLFAAQGDRAMSQRIYPLEHAAQGPVELFLVPVGRDAHGLLLEAIFT